MSTLASSEATRRYRFRRGTWERWNGRRYAPATYALHPAWLHERDAWTARPQIDDAQRDRLLEQAVDAELLGRATLVGRSRAGAVLGYKRPVSHVAHALLTLFTGVWGFVWIAMCLARKEDRVRLEVDSWGNVWPWIGE